MIVKNVTLKMRKYLQDKCVNLTKLSQETNIPYQTLYNSVRNKKQTRELRVDEFMSICLTLDVDPRDFTDKPKTD